MTDIGPPARWAARSSQHDHRHRERAGSGRAIRDGRYPADPAEETIADLCEVIFGDKHAPGHRKKPKHGDASWTVHRESAVEGAGDPDDWDDDPALSRQDRSTRR